MADGAEGKKQEEGDDDDEDRRPVAAPGHAGVCRSAVTVEFSSVVLSSPPLSRAML
jgi:hypothetical protein